MKMTEANKETFKDLEGTVLRDPWMFNGGGLDPIYNLVKISAQAHMDKAYLEVRLNQIQLYSMIFFQTP